MATTEYGVNHPLAVKLWSRKIMREALKQTYASRFMGSTTGSLIYVKKEASKGPGDRITYGLRMQLSGDGVEGDATLEGSEEALTTYTDNILINQLRNAVRSNGKMTEQRIPFSIREEARSGLEDWWAGRIDECFFNSIAGNTTVTDTKRTGHNATTAPTTTSGNSRHLFSDGTHTTEASLSTTDVFQLSFIDRVVNAAKIASPVLRPINYKGGQWYVMFLHPHQVYSLRTDATSGRITWYTTQKALVEGGGQGEESNGIFTGALGHYNGVVLHESTRIPSITANVRRAVLCGAQAACMAHGRDSANGEMSWSEELFDYKNQLGVEAGMIWGLKKSVFNSIDFGTIVMSTRAVAP
jgi:N4-gp56 family major capsid protein